MPVPADQDGNPMDPVAAGGTRSYVFTLPAGSAGSIAPNTAADFNNGREGDQLLVNGVRRPVDTVAPGRTERWRITNATNARYLQLALDGAAMNLVALDGSMLAQPRAVSTLLLAPVRTT